MQRRTRIFAIVTGSIILLLAAAMLSMQIPAVQTGIAEYVTRKLVGKFDGTITFSKIKILPISAIVLDDVTITDAKPYQNGEDCFPPVDTFFTARKVSANIYLGSLLRKGALRFGRVAVDGGMMHLTIEPDSLYPVNLTRIFRIPPTPPGTPVDTSDIFQIRRVRLDDFRYRMTIFGMEGIRAARKPFEMAWEDLDVNLDARVHALKFTGGRMGGVADHIRLEEKSGFKCSHIAGTTLVGRGEARITDLKIIEENSDVNIPLLLFSYKNGASWGKFIDEVRITGKVAPSLLALRTLRFYAPVFERNGAVLRIKNADVDGPVRHLSVSNFEFRDTVSLVSGTIDARGDGLPELDDLRMDVSLRDWRFTNRGLGRFVNNFVNGKDLGIDKFLPDSRYTLNSHTKGHIDRFTEEMSLSSGIGSLKLSSTFKDITKRGKSEIETRIHTEALNIGSILRSETLGAVSADARTSMVLEGNKVRGRLDSCHVASIQLLGHNFHNLNAAGDIDGKNFNASLSVNDVACRMNATGKCEYDEERDLSRYSISGIIGDADLHAFGIDFHKGHARAAFSIDGSMEMEGSTRRLAELELGDVRLTDSTGVHCIGDIRSDYTAEEGSYRMGFHSPFLEGKLTTDRELTALGPSFIAQTVRSELPLLFDSPDPAPEHLAPFSGQLSLSTGSTRELLDFVYPSMYIERGTSLKATANTDGRINAELSSERIIAGKIRAKDLQLKAGKDNGRLTAGIDAGQLDLGALVLDGGQLVAEADDNSVDLRLSYEDVEGYEDNLDHNGSLSAEGELLRDSHGKPAFRIHPRHSRFMLGRDLWTLGDSEIRLGDRRLAMNNFSLDCNQQHIRIDGALATDSPDTLKLFVQNFDLETVDHLTHGIYGMGGSLSADATFISPLSGERLRLKLGMLCEELSLNRVDAGSIFLDSHWNDKAGRLDFNIQNSLNNYQCVDGHGWFSPAGKLLGADLELDKLNIAVLGPFLRDLFSETGGSISGRIKAEGKLGDISIASRNTRLNDALLRLAYTGVGYRFDGPIRIDDNRIICDNVRVSDSEGGKAILNGGLRHSKFKNAIIDAELNFEDMELLDSRSDLGNALYGKLYASGSARVKGPPDNLTIEAEARSTRAGNVTIGSSGPSISDNNGLLTFAIRKEVNEELLAFEKRAEEEARNAGNLNLRARLQVNPAVTINMPIDTESGSGISANGNGDMTVTMHTGSDQLSLFGAYNIESGKFNYEIPGLLKKEFVLLDGSSINFGGDVINTDLDVKAVYKLSTSLSSLIADSTATNIRRHVDCGIQISGKIKNPKASFSIDVPDLDPTTKSEVTAALNTDDKVQKQFVSLLLFGTFVPSENSGIVNGSNIIYSNLTEMMMNQVNNVLAKLNIPVDLGFGYQHGTAGNDVFDVAVSTQLFNNRVVVNGSMGNRKYKSSTSPGGDFVGDLDIEVKLDKPGRFRLKLFSHSADEYADYLDQSQRNGLGFSFQQEFNNLGTYFRNIFTPRKKRKTENKSANEQPVIIKVE